MRELPGLEGDYEEPTASASESAIEKPKSPARYNIEKNLDIADKETLDNLGYPRPNDFFDTDTERLREILGEVKNDIKDFSYKISGFKRSKKMSEEKKKILFKLYNGKKIRYINTKTFLTFI